MVTASRWFARRPGRGVNYEKTPRNYIAVVSIGCVMLWLRI